MLTLEELLRLIGDSAGICCTNAEQRNATIEFMLQNGFQHGGSGVSAECLNGKHENTWMCVTARTASGIEFYRKKSPLDNIAFEEVEHIIRPQTAVQVDDLL